jgi:anti-sigma regulatory factor (Ser/Thr protein kinase)
MDEVGQVARAFDAVQRQALKLATEQAGLRAKYSSVFVNLSRRSQSLVQRQLQLLERLERDEEDADQLATLFQLDHLATRMRRNNENLMVLSGSDVVRRNQRPASLADLLRASVSEIEQYQRVVMLPPPDVQVVGYAVGDLVRLTAELLDNATAFSAPDTQVTIASHSFEDGSLCIAVLDEGIGMSKAELDEANDKLGDSGSIDVSTSRRMGLFVIGRLSVRHGVEVRLNGGHEVTGVRATVTVPADLVSAAGADTSTTTSPAVSAPPSGGLTPFSPHGAQVNGHVNGAGNAGDTNGSAVNGSSNGTSNGTGLANGFKPTPLPRRNWQGTGLRKPARDDAQPAPEQKAAPEEPATADTAPDTALDTPATVDTPEPSPEGKPAATESGPEREVLPRRSPGTRMPGPAPRRPAGPGDTAEIGAPRPPDPQIATGRGLFTPPSRDEQDTGWWTPSGPGTPVDPRAIDETTPIFDEMISAWFRAVSDNPDAPPPPPPTRRPPQPATQAPARRPAPPPAQPQRAPEPSRAHGQDDEWRFAADSGFDAARSVSRAAPDTFTENGLPRRSAGQNLVPGSAGGAAAGPARHGRAAEDMRDRLSDYRHGVRRAREHRQGHEPEPGPPPEPQPRDSGPLDLSGVGWRFAADVGWRAANAVSTSTPVDFTSGGLPRRSAGQNLVPGSAAPSGGGPLRMERAKELRGRLGSFQKGLSRGRRSLVDRGTGNASPENKESE